MIKEEALVKAMVDAIVAPSDEEAEIALKLTLEIARNMRLGEVIECQKKSLEIIAKLTQEQSTIH
jgi:hypothetical protein